MAVKPFLFFSGNASCNRILQIALISIYFPLVVACGSIVHNSVVPQETVSKADPCPSCVTVQISPLSVLVPPGGRQQFSATVSNTSNSAVTWSASAGSISSSGVFSAPASAGAKTVTVTATSLAQSSVHASTTISIATTEALKIMNATVPAASVGSLYDVPLAANGGTAPYQWSVLAGSLPTGLHLDSGSGTIHGTIYGSGRSGTYGVTVGVADASAQTAQQTLTLQVANATDCGPPTYNCSRAGMDIVQMPRSIPGVGNLSGANTVVTDPDFGNPIVRITDSETDPAAPWGSARTFVSSTSGSADENLWNVDSTLFVLQANNGATYPFAFNPSTLQATRLYRSKYPATAGLKLSDSGTWSRVSPSVLYGYTGASIVKYDFTDRSNAPVPGTVFDFAKSGNCLPPGFSVTWRSKGGVSAGDGAFGVAFSNQGGQGTGVYAVAYTVGHGCSVLNTRTGQVSGEWGASGSINIPDRWTIHNAKISKDGKWLIVAPQKCISSDCSKGPYFWKIGTTTVNSCGTSGKCGGHWTEGYDHWVNNDNSPLGNQVIRHFSDSEAAPGDLTNRLPEGISGPFDQHQSWNSADPNDSSPLLASTWSSISPFPAPWYNEIIGVATDGSGKVWRFAHSFITTRSQTFSTQYAIGSVSQDGRFFLFSSDWMGTLGSESGAHTCKIGKNCRGDVFVVELN